MAFTSYEAMPLDQMLNRVQKYHPGEGYKLVEKAWKFLNTPALPRDGYYRFICRKCSPVMAYYGRLDQAEELRSRAEKENG